MIDVQDPSMPTPSDHGEDPKPLHDPAGTLGPQLEGLRPRLERMVAVRLDPRLRRRVDPSDVIQEAFAEVTRRLEEYRAKSPLPFFLWVRLIAGQKLAQIHRLHLGAAGRDVGREVTPGNIPSANSASLAERFVDPGPSPQSEAAHQEALARVRHALDGLDALERELLALRYFEGLSLEEVALILGLSASTAKRRHLNALRALRAALPHSDDVPTP